MFSPWVQNQSSAKFGTNSQIILDIYRPFLDFLGYFPDFVRRKQNSVGRKINSVGHNPKKVP